MSHPCLKNHHHPNSLQKLADMAVIRIHMLPVYESKICYELLKTLMQSQQDLNNIRLTLHRLLTTLDFRL